MPDADMVQCLRLTPILTPFCRRNISSILLAKSKAWSAGLLSIQDQSRSLWYPEVIEKVSEHVSRIAHEFRRRA